MALRFVQKMAMTVMSWKCQTLKTCTALFSALPVRMEITTGRMEMLKRHLGGFCPQPLGFGIKCFSHSFHDCSITLLFVRYSAEIGPSVGGILLDRIITNIEGGVKRKPPSSLRASQLSTSNKGLFPNFDHIEKAVVRSLDDSVLSP